MNDERHRATPGVVRPISTGIVAAITGFARSFVLVIDGLRTVGASEAQASSGLLALCLLVGVACIALPWHSGHGLRHYHRGDRVRVLGPGRWGSVHALAGLAQAPPRLG